VRALWRVDRGAVVSAPTRERLRSLYRCLRSGSADLRYPIRSSQSAGRKAYGPLDIHGDRRDWGHEASEEALDCAVYLAAETLRREAQP
jgi:hypothetical protein